MFDYGQYKQRPGQVFKLHEIQSCITKFLDRGHLPSPLVHLVEDGGTNRVQRSYIFKLKL